NNGAATLNSPIIRWMSASGSSFTVTNGNTPTDGSVLSGAFDLNGDRRTDLVWQSNGDGTSPISVNVWVVSSGAVTSSALSAPVGSSLGDDPNITYWRGADFNGDGIADLLWTRGSWPDLSSRTGLLALWLGNGDGTFNQVSGADSSVDNLTPT